MQVDFYRLDLQGSRSLMAKMVFLNALKVRDPLKDESISIQRWGRHYPR